MKNSFELVRSLVIYAICLPLAVFLGYCLTDPLTYSTFGAISLLMLILLSPLFLRWHHQLLLLSWNAVMVVFVMKGQPDLWLLVVPLSLGISILQMAMNRRVRFVPSPTIVWPLLCMLVVVVLTARYTGGFGLKAMGSGVFGGKRYVYLIGAILGYFALTAHRIPTDQARFYIKLYLIGGVTAMVGDFFSYVSPSLYFIFWIFPPNLFHGSDIEFGVTRLGGFASAATAIGYFMMGIYGIRGIFDTRKSWRLLLFAATFILGMLGGFRSSLILFLMVFTVQFFLEGLHRTRLLPGLCVAGVLSVVLLIPFASKLPLTMQRALSFLPVHVDSEAEQDADASMDWRVRMWEALLPQIPKYLLLGKGYALSPQDFDAATSNISDSPALADNMGASITGDYHSGPLSVVLTFGIWGVITFLWFLIAGVRLLYQNYRFSPPEFRVFNAFFLACFLARIVQFFLVFGSLHGDMSQFVGLLGLSVSLNGGMRSKLAEPAVDTSKKPGVRDFLSRPRPAFQQ